MDDIKMTTMHMVFTFSTFLDVYMRFYCMHISVKWFDLTPLTKIKISFLENKVCDIK